MNKNLSLNTLLTTVLLMTAALPSFSTDSKEKNFNPKPASASVYNLGLKSYEQGDLQSATTYFKRAVDLDPNFVDAYYNLGEIYKTQKNYYDSTKAFEKALEINPNDYEVMYELALCYLEDKNYPKAKKYFSSILPSAPQFNDSKQKLETVNRYLAIETANQAGDKSKSVINSPEVQAQLLVDKLGTAETQRGNAETQRATAETQKEQIQLQKPSKENFQGEYKIVTDKFKGPTGIAKDSKNNVYVANFAKDNIERVSTSGGREIFVEKIGLKGPVGLAIDENDNLYVANYNNGSIVKITPHKEVSILVQKLEKPYYLLYDSSSKKLYATAQGNNSLIEIDTLNVSKQPLTSR